MQRACWKIWIQFLKETNLGVAQAFLSPKRYQLNRIGSLSTTIQERSLWYIVDLKMELRAFLLLLYLWVHPKRHVDGYEHANWDQNAWFIPLSETMSITDLFIGESSLGISCVSNTPGLKGFNSVLTIRSKINNLMELRFIRLAFLHFHSLLEMHNQIHESLMMLGGLWHTYFKAHSKDLSWG